MTRRLRQIPVARIVFGLWSLPEHGIAEAEDAERNIGADLVATSLRQAVEEVGFLGVTTLDKLAPLEGGHELPALAKS
jgi:hypothetical protein